MERLLALAPPQPHGLERPINRIARYTHAGFPSIYTCPRVPTCISCT
uniref:Uncharacterized protein n=1 Tax=Anguilla anguilla TaxID=7936 RepID=A0A0E9R0K6_ANGAN